MVEGRLRQGGRATDEGVPRRAAAAAGHISGRGDQPEEQEHRAASPVSCAEVQICDRLIPPLSSTELPPTGLRRVRGARRREAVKESGADRLRTSRFHRHRRRDLPAFDAFGSVSPLRASWRCWLWRRHAAGTPAGRLPFRRGCHVGTHDIHRRLFTTATRDRRSRLRPTGCASTPPAAGRHRIVPSASRLLPVKP